MKSYRRIILGTIALCATGCASPSDPMMSSRAVEQNFADRCKALDAQYQRALAKTRADQAAGPNVISTKEAIADMDTSASAGDASVDCYRHLTAMENANDRIKLQLLDEQIERERRAVSIQNPPSEPRIIPNPGYTSISQPPEPPAPNPVGTLAPYPVPPAAAPSTKFIPYDAVAPVMPGIGPDGQAR